MKYSKDLTAAAHRIAKKWWNRDTYFGFIDLTTEGIANDLAALRRLAPETVKMEIEGIESWLQETRDFIAAGNANDAANSGMRAGVSFFKLVSDIARNRGTGATEHPAWLYIHRIYAQHPTFRIGKEIVRMGIEQYEKEHPELPKVANQASFVAHFSQHVRRKTHA